jgi:hypothetical protein
LPTAQDLRAGLLAEESASSQRQADTKAELKGKYDGMREHYREK